VPTEDPDPLEAFKKQIERRKRSNKRIVRLRLFPNRYEQETLFDIGLACTRLWNELNYDKRNAFFNRELSPEKRDKINKKYYHEKYLDAMYKRDERLRHLYIIAIRFLADELYRRGVRKLYIGYPIMLSQNNGNEYNTNIWWFRKIVLWIVDVFREYSIEVKIVSEDYTSKQCSICGNKHKNGRKHRGLYICSKTGKKINAGINATLNIVRRLGHRIRISRKIESYSITHNDVKPLNPRQRANTQDPSIETPPLKGGVRLL
jgi:transposase